MNDAVADIKSKIAIEDLVSQYVQLKKVGNSFKGLCPFHAEKTPSFVVNPERGIAYCFGCHKGGDVFKFIEEIENVDFVDALKLLAERTGVELKQYQPVKRISVDEKEQLLHIHELSAAFYQKCLWETKDGEKVLDYLHVRGLTDETIKQFRLGFAPDSFDQTNTMLLKEGFTKKMLISSGLAMTKDTTLEHIYDRFRGRLMFPILDSLSRVVGFGGRALKKDQEPKYLNSPETAIYHKSHILYGFSATKLELKRQETVLIVEGYMDFLAAYQSGVKNVVASSGTAFTLQQMRLLQPFVKSLILGFDMDLAGQEAAKRAFDLVSDFDLEIKVLELSSGKDIAEFALTHAQELIDLVAKSQTYGDYVYQKLIKTYGIETIQAKRKILQEFNLFFSTLGSSIEKDDFVRKLACDLQLTEVQIYDEIKNFKLSKFHPARIHEGLEELKVKKYSSDELLLGFLIEFARLGQIYKDQIQEEFFSEDLKAIYKAFLDNYNRLGPDYLVKHFIASLPQELAEKASFISFYISEMYGEMAENVVEEEIKGLILSLKKNYFGNKKRNLQLQLIQAEKTGDKALREQLLSELHHLHTA